MTCLSLRDFAILKSQKEHYLRIVPLFSNIQKHLELFYVIDKESLCLNFLFFKVYFIDYAITAVPFFSPLFPSTLHALSHRHFPPSSCSWVVHISSLTYRLKSKSDGLFLASPQLGTWLTTQVPILFLTSPCLFWAYHLCFLFPVLFPNHSHHLPTHNPPCDPHFCESVPSSCLLSLFLFLVQLLIVVSLSFYCS